MLVLMDQAFMDFIRHSIESHDRQIGELTDKLAVLQRSVQAQSANIDKLVEVTNRDAADIRALARIAESHDKRLDELERKRPE
jgi:ABC-type transporter Mla subunit MlaD